MVSSPEIEQRRNLTLNVERSVLATEPPITILSAIGTPRCDHDLKVVKANQKCEPVNQSSYSQGTQLADSYIFLCFGKETGGDYIGSIRMEGNVSFKSEYRTQYIEGN